MTLLQEKKNLSVHCRHRLRAVKCLQSGVFLSRWCKMLRLFPALFMNHIANRCVCVCMCLLVCLCRQRAREREMHASIWAVLSVFLDCALPLLWKSLHSILFGIDSRLVRNLQLSMTWYTYSQKSFIFTRANVEIRHYKTGKEYGLCVWIDLPW